MAIAALGIAAYHATFRVPFLFDDASAVTGNATIHSLWPVSSALHAPADSTVAGRPLLNLSFAVNYAIGAENPAGYHAVNLAVHLLAAFVLCGIVRRTLASGKVGGRFQDAATMLAFTIAATWALHPLQTISVTYVSQRAESLMGLCYFLTLYAFVRRTTSVRQAWWDLAGAVSFAFGMATKEVAMTAPVMVLLYDRTFVSGTFRDAWKRHWRIYLGFAAIWILAGTRLMDLRAHGVGLGLGVSAWRYALTECEVVVRYVALAVWPHPLVFDYGEEIAKPSALTAPYALALIALLSATLVALRRRPALGFLGAWFFVTLAPTSSVVPIVHQPMAENRVYLPLAAVVALAVCAVFSRIGARGYVAFAVVLVLGVASLTLRRNEDFEREIVLWRDTVSKRPDNARAHYNLGHAFSAVGQPLAAVVEYEAALALKPDYAEAHHNLANALAALRRREEALPHYEAALRIQPAYASAHYNLATTLAELDRVPEAIEHFEAALKLEPKAAGVHYNLANALVRIRRVDEALSHFSEAVRLSPNYPEAETNWGNLLASAGRPDEALTHYEAALRSNPDYLEARVDFGNALLQLHRPDEAMDQYKLAISRRPDSAPAHYNLGNIYLARGQLAEAIAEFKLANQHAEIAGAHHNLALALVRSGRPREALAEYRETLRLMPESAVAHHNYAAAWGKLGNFPEAIAEEETALRLQPDFPAASEYLAWLRRQ